MVDYKLKVNSDQIFKTRFLF